MSPPFAMLILSLAHFFDVVLDLGRIGKRKYDITNHKPPFIVMDGLSDLSFPENRYFSRGYFFIHISSFQLRLPRKASWPEFTCALTITPSGRQSSGLKLF